MRLLRLQRAVTSRLIMSCRISFILLLVRNVKVKTRTISYVNALNEAQDEILTQDPDAYIIGLGVPGPTGIFGSTSGLLEKHGPDRVLDMPLREA